VGLVVVMAPAGLEAQTREPGGEAQRPRPDRRESESDEQDLLEGTFRTGVEYDSNARRTSADLAEGDGLGRYFLSLDGEVPSGEGSGLSLQLRHGGKWFFRERESDALLTRVGLRYRHRLGETVHGFFRAGFKDRQEREGGPDGVGPRQDYNRGSAATGVGVSSGRWAGRVGLGWRYFGYRPNPASSNHGPRGSASVSYQLFDDLRLRARYGFSYRNFDAIRFVRRAVDGGDSVVQRDRSGERRNDRLHLVRIGGSYRRSFILSAHYLLLRNGSNSYGQAMTRHGFEVDTTIPLFWKLYLSAKLSLQRTSYEDPLFLSADLQVDEENRNSVVASLTRVVGDHWEVEARYRLFIEEFGAASEYRRQTGFLGVGYVF
jgi:hypothetical protein